MITFLYFLVYCYKHNINIGTIDKIVVRGASIKYKLRPKDTINVKLYLKNCKEISNFYWLLDDLNIHIYKVVNGFMFEHIQPIRTFNLKLNITLLDIVNYEENIPEDLYLALFKYLRGFLT